MGNPRGYGAQACGYRRVVSTDEPEELRAALAAKRDDGPASFHVRIRPGAPVGLPRPEVGPAEVFARLQGWIAGS